MISTSSRTPKMTETNASIKTQGHLALLEWDETAPSMVEMSAKHFGDPNRRSLMDRCYNAGTLVLMAVTVAGLAASLFGF